jgi:hypothetical protein
MTIGVIGRVNSIKHTILPVCNNAIGTRANGVNTIKIVPVFQIGQPWESVNNQLSRTDIAAQNKKKDGKYLHWTIFHKYNNKGVYIGHFAI